MLQRLISAHCHRNACPKVKTGNRITHVPSSCVDWVSLFHIRFGVNSCLDPQTWLNFSNIPQSSHEDAGIEFQIWSGSLPSTLLAIYYSLTILIIQRCTVWATCSVFRKQQWNSDSVIIFSGTVVLPHACSQCTLNSLWQCHVSWLNHVIQQKQNKQTPWS